jgi:hypothetical protein
LNSHITTGFFLVDFLFPYCTALESITLPSRTSYIPQQFFQGCIKLQNVILPELVQAIGSLAYRIATAYSIAPTTPATAISRLPEAELAAVAAATIPCTEQLLTL